jgi:hypothetical protein
MQRPIKPENLMQEPLLLGMPIIERMRRIDGWLADAEADLLIAAAAQATREFPEARCLRAGQRP